MNDESCMRLAIEAALEAQAIGEVPIGAVIVRDGQVIGRGFNRRESWRDPTAHAEMIAIRQASETLGGWRLPGTTMYVTLEPCPMCAGAMMLARIERLVFGVRDPKGGCVGSIYNLVQEPRFNHRLEVTEGVLAEECGALLKNFFRNLRSKRGEMAELVDCARLESE
ncbi:MAG: tRNA adenosine(34) deaminase TadA [Bacillota bacterium]